MSSRTDILSRVKENQPSAMALPMALSEVTRYENPVEVYVTMLGNIGGTTVLIENYEAIQEYIKANFPAQQRIISTLPELAAVTENNWELLDPHSYENVDLAIIKAHFGVAENAALWITEPLMQQRVVPFICQQLAVVVAESQIFSNMHEAYAQIADSSYDFGTFIAGPSKTADIEQSLVLGAHGPKNMTVFILKG